MTIKGDVVSEMTEADREKAASLLAEWGVQRTDEGALSVTNVVYVEDWRDLLAAALAEERQKVRAPFLALADELKSDVFHDDDTSPHGRGYNDAALDIADRIRRAAEEG